jgi:hypothetical protein
VTARRANHFFYNLLYCNAFCRRCPAHGSPRHIRNSNDLLGEYGGKESQSWKRLFLSVQHHYFALNLCERRGPVGSVSSNNRGRRATSAEANASLSGVLIHVLFIATNESDAGHRKEFGTLEFLLPTSGRLRALKWRPQGLGAVMLHRFPHFLRRSYSQSQRRLRGFRTSFSSSPKKTNRASDSERCNCRSASSFGNVL